MKTDSRNKGPAGLGSRVPWLLLAGCACSCLGAVAPEPKVRNLADLSLEELMEIPVESVVSASKYEQKITRAPTAVTIVTREEIAAFGHRTLADVLRSVRGLYVSDDGNYSYLGARGFLRPGDYNTRVLVLIDGHRMNDNIYDAAYLGHENTIDVDMIERVEVVRGPSSSIYGSSAFFGVVNLVTRQAALVDGAEIASEAGSFGTYKGRFSYGKRFASDSALFLSAVYYRSDGRAQIYYPEFDQRTSPDPRAANNGIAQNADGETAASLFSSFRYRDLTVSGFLSTREKTVPTASFYTVFNDSRAKTTDNRAYLDVKFDHAFSPDVRLLARAYYDFYYYHGDYPYEYAEPGMPSDIAFSKDETRGEWTGTEWQLTSTMGGRHTVAVGAEFRENLRQEQLAYDDTVPRNYTVVDEHTSRTLALYAQGEFRLHPRLVFNAGLRYDGYFDSFGGTLNPRLGLIYNPQERTTVKLLYGQAFRAPNAYERYYYSNQHLVDLIPEKIHTYEFTADHYFTQRFRLGASAFRYNVSKLITQVATPEGAIYFSNLNRAESTGLELEMEGKYASGLRLRTSYVLQRTKDGTTGEELTSSPRQMAKAGLIYPILRDQFTAGLELQYQGRLRTLSGREVDGFLLGNLTLSTRPLAHGFEFSASVYNLFNTGYGYPGAEDHAQDILPQPGRSFRFKVGYKF